jgi:hypothetical protein
MVVLYLFETMCIEHRLCSVVQCSAFVLCLFCCASAVRLCALNIDYSVMLIMLCFVLFLFLFNDNVIVLMCYYLLTVVNFLIKKLLSI